MQSAALDHALREAAERYTAANPQSLDQHRRAARFLPGGNTRSVLYGTPFPITLSGGYGARVRSLDGREYLDFLGDYTAGLYGHSNPILQSAIAEALAGGISLGGHTRYEERYASLLQQRFPSLERLRFTNSGTEANLLALLTARAASGRERVVVFEGGYHGSVLNFTTASNPMNVPLDFIPAPYNDVGQTQEILRRHGEAIAAVLVEPMLGSGGCVAADADFLRLLKDFCTAHGAVLIFDEVMTSRLAPGGRQAAVGIRPDLTTLGKYLGGGLSFGAFGGRADLMDRFDPRRPDPLVHAGTFNNNVLSLAAGLAGLGQVFTVEEVLRLNRCGEQLRAELNALAGRAALPVVFSGIGSMMNVHLCRGPIRGPADAARGSAGLRDLFYFDMLEHGIWCARRGMLNLSLPMRPEDLQALIEAVGVFLSTRAGLLRKADG
jgi:glutamate-1-semialdehyde 2,1-aminomutase